MKFLYPDVVSLAMPTPMLVINGATGPASCGATAQPAWCERAGGEWPSIPRAARASRHPPPHPSMAGKIFPGDLWLAPNGDYYYPTVRFSN